VWQPQSCITAVLELTLAFDELFHGTSLDIPELLLFSKISSNIDDVAVTEEVRSDDDDNNMPVADNESFHPYEPVDNKSIDDTLDNKSDVSSNDELADVLEEDKLDDESIEPETTAAVELIFDSLVADDS
jgi:hypothetical protein